MTSRTGDLCSPLFTALDIYTTQLNTYSKKLEKWCAEYGMSAFMKDKCSSMETLLLEHNQAIHAVLPKIPDFQITGPQSLARSAIVANLNMAMKSAIEIQARAKVEHVCLINETRQYED